MCGPLLRAALWAGAVIAATPPANAGPWLREEGSVFLSFGQNLALSDGAQLPVNVDPHLYAEWGMSERVTLVFAAFSGDAGRETTIEMRGVMALPLPDGSRDALSATLGAGARVIDGTEGVEPLLQGGISWGRGLSSGWIMAEALLTYRPRSGRHEGKVDLTWGHTFTNRWTGYVLATAGEGHTGEFYAKVSPNAVFTLNDHMKLSLGLTQAVTGDRGTGLAFSSWLEF